MANSTPLPVARTDRLVVKELPEETLVYDLDRHRAHRLNRAATLVWRGCDGETTAAELAARLPGDLPLADREAAVCLDLDQLHDAHLLVGPAGRPPSGEPRVSRRALILKVGVAASIAVVPLVSSVLVPTAQAQASPPTTILLTGASN